MHKIQFELFDDAPNLYNLNKPKKLLLSIYFFINKLVLKRVLEVLILVVIFLNIFIIEIHILNCKEINY
ncbi:MAG: hypothetical protein CFE25_17185 [Chitinophagaceae bacterium BSSC1]|nr:MAG: hypothetical protein CFE25_17185 [Chitinophagaceae bacterium BSSC1]